MAMPPCGGRGRTGGSIGRTGTSEGQGHLVFQGLAQDFESLLAEYSDAERQAIDGFLRQVNRAVADRADRHVTMRDGVVVQDG